MLLENNKKGLEGCEPKPSWDKYICSVPIVTCKLSNNIKSDLESDSRGKLYIAASQKGLNCK